MKSQISIFAIVIAALMMCTACGGQGGLHHAVDTVAVATTKLADTTSFVKLNGERCEICAEASISYPVQCVDAATLEQVPRWFASTVLEAPDSVSLPDAMRLSVVNTMHQYDMTAQSQNSDVQAAPMADDDAAMAVYRYNTSTTINIFGQRHGVVTFCRVEMVKKNDQVTSIAHHYYSYDLQNGNAVDLGKVFKEESLPDVCQLLKRQLLAQNKVASDDQLNELGFYNSDNLTVTQNFYFDETGLRWSFLPNELAVEAVGEPCITVPYEMLMPLAADGSVLTRF